MLTFAIRLALVLAFVCSAYANPLGGLWSRFKAIGDDPCTINDSIVPRDFTKSPQCDPWEIDSPAVLAAHVTSAQLYNVKEPAKFMNLRMEKAFPPTKAVMVSYVTKTTTPVNPRYMATKEQAEKYRLRLDSLARVKGLTCSLEVWESDRDLIGGRYDYSGEDEAALKENRPTRRVYYLRRAGNHDVARSASSVGLILAAYMNDTEESVDARIEVVDLCRE